MHHHKQGFRICVLGIRVVSALTARAALWISALAIRIVSALIARAALRIDLIAVSPLWSPKSVKNDTRASYVSEIMTKSTCVR